MLHKWVTRLILTLFIVTAAVPVVGLVIFSIDNEGLVQWQSYTSLIADPTFQQSLVRSLEISLLSVALTILMITPPVWYGFLYSPRMLRLVEALSFIPFVLPAVVLGLAYVQFFSNPPLDLAGTPTLLPFAFSLFGMPYYIQSVLNRLRLMEARQFHEAAQSLGSSAAASFWKVQFPLLLPGVLVGSVLVFSIGMGEFTITQLTTGGSFMTLPIYLQVNFTNNPLSGAAMAVIAMLIAIIGVFAALGTFSRKRNGGP